jgi:hypothetical protein
LQENKISVRKFRERRKFGGDLEREKEKDCTKIQKKDVFEKRNLLQNKDIWRRGIARCESSSQKEKNYRVGSKIH